MLQKDYIKRILEQLSAFLNRLLKLNIEENKEQFCTDFEKMLDKFFHADISKLDEISSDKLESYIDNTSLKTKNILVFYKAAIVYFKTDKEISTACFNIAKQIETIQPNVFDVFEDIELTKELNHYREIAMDLFHD